MEMEDWRMGRTGVNTHVLYTRPRGVMWLYAVPVEGDELLSAIFLISYERAATASLETHSRLINDYANTFSLLALHYVDGASTDIPTDIMPFRFMKWV